MLLETLTRIKNMMAHWIPHKGIKSVPVARAPMDAPVRSAARQPAAGLLFSPMILVTTGNWNPQKNEKTKQYVRK